MASTVNVTVVAPGPGARAAVTEVEALFARVERACTRFDPASPLMRANAAGDAWAPVPVECYLALVEAARAHRRTGGLFEPRVLSTLVGLGYRRTLPFQDGPVHLTVRGPDAVPPAPEIGRVGRWRPEFDPRRPAVRIGSRPVDLGGIGKGLAARWAGELLAGHGRAALVEAGGDCHLGGAGPDGDGWRVAVEDPFGGEAPVAVLALAGTGCATSSVRVRSWEVDGRRVHHIVDPRTGRSADGGLRSVTVAGTDPATAEAWSKALLVAGRDRIGGLADGHGLAAFWVTDDGTSGCSHALRPAVAWTADGLGAGTRPRPYRSVRAVAPVA